MENKFDDLFNEFFGNNKPKGNNKENKPFSKLFDDISDLFNNLNSSLDDLNVSHDKKLGEPDEVIKYEENGFTFEKKIWNLNNGQMVKVDMISTPFDSVKGKVSLEKQLELALNEERYEDAAKIRDEIKSSKKSK